MDRCPFLPGQAAAEISQSTSPLFPEQISRRAFAMSAFMPKLDGPSIIGMGAATTRLIEQNAFTWDIFAKCRLSDEQVPLLGVAINALHEAQGILPRFAITKPQGTQADLWISPNDIQEYAQAWKSEVIRGSQNLIQETVVEGVTCQDTAEKPPLSKADPRLLRALGAFWQTAETALREPVMVQTARQYKANLAVIWHSDTEYDDKLEASMRRYDAMNQTVSRHVLFKLSGAREHIANLSGYQLTTKQLIDWTKLTFSIDVLA